MRIGFIGLGAMGAPMALNLVKAGHQVRGFDVRTGATDALVSEGGSAASSAADAARDADLLWLMVVSGEQAEAVLFSTAPPRHCRKARSSASAVRKRPSTPRARPSA